MHLKKQVINKFQIPQFIEPKWFSGLVTLFPVGGSRFESTGTLTNLFIVHYEFIAPSVASAQQVQPSYKQTYQDTNKHKNVSMTHVLSEHLHHSTEVSLVN
jgi:hypothetical protein